MNADFFPRELEALEMRGNEIYEKAEAEGVSAQKHRRHPPRIVGPAENEEAFKPAFLSLPQPFMDLGNSAQKHQNRAEDQQDNGEAKGGEEFPKTVRHKVKEEAALRSGGT
jgi:hypothetical protein